MEIDHTPLPRFLDQDVAIQTPGTRLQYPRRYLTEAYEIVCDIELLEKCPVIQVLNAAVAVGGELITLNDNLIALPVSLQCYVTA